MKGQNQKKTKNRYEVGLSRNQTYFIPNSGLVCNYITSRCLICYYYRPPQQPFYQPKERRKQVLKILEKGGDASPHPTCHS